MWKCVAINLLIMYLNCLADNLLFYLQVLSKYFHIHNHGDSMFLVAPPSVGGMHPDEPSG